VILGAVTPVPLTAIVNVSFAALLRIEMLPATYPDATGA
jgi:hypothetical protein